MALYTFNDNFNIYAPKHIDTRYINLYTPYTDAAQANSLIPIPYRYLGLTVLIGTGEWWYQMGITDGDLVPKAGGGFGIVTANNGLTVNIPSNVQLGGTLIQSTIIDTGNFTLNLNSSASLGNPVLSISLTGISASNNYALRVDNSQTTGSNYGGYFTSALGNLNIGIYASGNTVAIQGVNNNNSNNSLQPILQLYRRTTGSAPTTNIGGSIDFYIWTSVFSEQLSNQLITKWTNAVLATRTSELSITGVNSGVTATLLTISGSGRTQLNKYGTGTITGTAAYTLQVDASGNIIEGTPVPGSGLLTANNGLTANTATNVQLGGTLIQNTSIDNDIYTLSITGTTTSGLGSVNIVNTNVGFAVGLSSSVNGTGYGIVAGATTGAALFASTSTSSGTAGLFTAGSGVGVSAQSVSNVGGQFITNPTSTNTTVPIVEFWRTSSGGTAGNNIGGSIDFKLASNGGPAAISNQLVSVWTTAATGTRTSAFSINTVTTAVTATTFTVAGATITSFATSVGLLTGSAVTGIQSTGSTTGVYAASPVQPLWTNNTTTATNTIVDSLLMQRAGIYNGAANAGLRIKFAINDSAGTLIASTGEFSNYLTTATAGAATSQFEFKTLNAGALTSSFIIQGNGGISIVQGLGNFANDAAAAGGGIAVNQLYRNGSIVMIRVT